MKDIYPSIREVLLDCTTDKLLKGKALEAAHASQILIDLINKQNEILEGAEVVRSLYLEQQRLESVLSGIFTIQQNDSLQYGLNFLQTLLNNNIEQKMKQSEKLN